MEYHESALDAILGDDFACSDVEEGEIEDGELPGLQRMDVDGAELITTVEDGEILEDDPSLGAIEDGGNGNDQHEANGNLQVLEFNSGSGHHDNCASRPASKRKKNRRLKRTRPGPKRQNADVTSFVQETCSFLQEKKTSLIWALVKKLGVEAVRDFLNEVNVIENCGGQLTNDKERRRRTPGGVLWNILKGRVQPQVYREIMSQGNEFQKQKTKEVKESQKRQRMDVDEPANNKRQKMAIEEGDVRMTATNGKQGAHPKQLMKVTRNLSIFTDGPVRDDSLLPTIQLQKAWVEGIRKKDEGNGVGTVTSNVQKSDLGLSKGHIDLKGCSEIMPAPVVDRLRMPVQYDDLVTQAHDEVAGSETPEQGESFR